MQPVGGERQAGEHRVDPVVEQRGAGLSPAQVQDAHLGVGMPAAQVAHRRGEREVADVADDDPRGPRGGPGGRRGLGGGTQQGRRERQEHLSGLGEPGALRGAVEQPGPHLLFEAADLPAQRGLGEVQVRGGPAEVPVPGDDGERAHQPQIEVLRRAR